MRKVEVVAYTEAWAEAFGKAAAEIEALLGAECLEVHHIGSTAVPGLAAKPVIDLLVVVGCIELVDCLNVGFLKLGYEPKGENGLPGRRYFEKGGNDRTHHVHCYEQGNPEIMRHLKFRDFLRRNPEHASAYGGLKKTLAACYPWDINRYIEGKQEMIREIESLAEGEI